MKAVRLLAPEQPLEVLDVPDPTPADDEVLVKVAGCGVCHTDIGFWLDGVPTNRELPLTLGHEISGTVVDAGAQYHEMIGREVIVPAVIPCGDCELCAAGRGNVCRSQIMPGNDIDGGFAEFVVVPGRGLCPAKDRGTFELAEVAVVADAVTTPYQAILRSGLEAGELAIVVGVGGVGTHCAQIAAALGATVIALDVDDERLAAVEGFGPSLTLNPGSMDFRSLKGEVRAHAASHGCSPHGWKIFECSGSAAGQQTAYGLLTHAATLVVIGFTLAKTELRLSNLMAFDATVIGTWGCRPELYPEALDLVARERIQLRPFIETAGMSSGPDVLRAVADHEMRRRAILVPDWNE
jgi:6-hydroxycyclohex-1-ene-1-carbonyl-CoA dehydrogenase